MNLTNKKVIIKEGIYRGEWGTVRMFDGEYYHVALWGGDDCLVFYRDEIRVPRNKKV